MSLLCYLLLCLLDGKLYLGTRSVRIPLLHSFCRSVLPPPLLRFLHHFFTSHKVASRWGGGADLTRGNKPYLYQDGHLRSDTQTVQNKA